MVRRRGATAMAVGAALTGVLAYVFFALVVRAIGATAAAPVSVLWTYWSFAAAGVTFPVQHWVARTIAHHGGQEGAVRAAMVRLTGLVVAASVVTGVLAWLARDPLFHQSGVTFPLLVTALTFGSAWVGLVRGSLTARGDLVGVAGCLVAENALRCVLVIGLMAAGVDDARWYGVALALGQITALLWPAAVRPHGPSTPEPWLRFVGAVAGGQLVSQTVLSGGPLLLALLEGAPHQVTGLFAALALFRAPYTFAIGALSPLTALFTRMVAQRRYAALWRTVIVTGAGTAFVVVVAAAIGGTIGPWLLRLVFGSSVRLPASVTLLVAIGSGLALGSLALSLLAMARDHSRAMLRAWLVAIVAAAVVVLLGPGSALTTVAWAFVAAQTVAFAVMYIGALTVRRGHDVSELAPHREAKPPLG